MKEIPFVRNKKHYDGRIKVFQTENDEKEIKDTIKKYIDKYGIMWKQNKTLYQMYAPDSMEEYIKLANLKIPVGYSLSVNYSGYVDEFFCITDTLEDFFNAEYEGKKIIETLINAELSITELR